MLPTFHLAATDPIETNVQLLNEAQPDIVAFYPSIAPILNKEKREGRLKITPRVLACSAEPMSEERRREIEEVWGIQPYNAYATTEAGIMASECEFHQGMHIFEDMMIVEVVDQENRPIPPGATGDKILLTVLYRRAQPLIRYEMTDLLRRSSIESCPCGRPFELIDTIQGRKLDVLHFPARKGGEIAVTSDIFNSVLDITPVTGWQVIRELDGLRILLMGAPEKLLDEQVADSLQKALARQDIIIPPIQVQRVTTLIKSASGKTPMIISHIPQDDLE
jgi:phenylacetate-coenzyme A ligase PaaK-like adenylate-forming protein